MELVTSLASTAVLGIGSMVAFNTPIKTLRNLCANGSKGVCHSWPSCADWSPLACHHETLLSLVMVFSSSPLVASRS